MTSLKAEKKSDIAERAKQFISSELFALRYASKLNGCEITPEWQDQIEIFEYLQRVVDYVMEWSGDNDKQQA